jgi:glycosyltransferase involved in cell wall biosynthesis
MRLLISALSCNPAFGSEALVGFKLAEALARRHEVTVLAAPPCKAPAGAVLWPCDAGACSFNEVGPVPLLRFELRQWCLARRRRSGGWRSSLSVLSGGTDRPDTLPCERQHTPKRELRPGFEVVHRITPSAISCPTLLHWLGRPLVVGPLIAGKPLPASFHPYLHRPVSRPAHGKAHPQRIFAGLCRRLVALLDHRRTHLERAALILCGTRAAREQVPERWRSKCAMITYAGVEHDLFVPTAWMPRPAPMRLLFVGRLVPYKGIELLLRALVIAAKHVPLHLDIVGTADPVYQAFLVEWSRDHGVAVSTGDGGSRAGGPQDRSAGVSLRSPDFGLPTVRFLPSVPRAELPRVYQAADVFCLPSVETYGIALLEAMSCARAVVVTDRNGPGEIVPEGAGLRIPMHTPEQFIHDYAQGLVGLARNPDLRLKLGERARQHILLHHDWSRIGARLLEVYEERALATRRRPRGSQPAASAC